MESKKNLLKFILVLGMSFDKALVDKKIDVTDLGLFVTPITLLPAAIEGAKSLKGYKPTSEELAELVAFAKVELKLENAKIEFMVEKALDLGLMIFDFVVLFKKEEAVVA